MPKISSPLRRSFGLLPESSSFTTSVVRNRIIRITVLTATIVILLHLCASVSIAMPVQETMRTDEMQLSYYEDDVEEAESDGKPGYLHLLIPASKPDQNLCKTVLSAGILNYPSPRLVNWNQEFEDPNLVAGGSHIGKISGIKAYLDGMDVARDSDLVLMVDGYDVWFQLRPQTILDRYFDINRRANERIQKELGDKVVKQHNIHQQIVFSCQKRCWLFSEDDPECYAVPQSSLPDDIYGPETSEMKRILISNSGNDISTRAWPLAPWAQCVSSSPKPWSALNRTRISAATRRFSASCSLSKKSHAKC